MTNHAGMPFLGWALYFLKYFSFVSVSCFFFFCYVRASGVGVVVLFLFFGFCSLFLSFLYFCLSFIYFLGVLGDAGVSCAVSYTSLLFLQSVCCCWYGASLWCWRVVAVGCLSFLLTGLIQLFVCVHWVAICVFGCVVSEWLDNCFSVPGFGVLVVSYSIGFFLQLDLWGLGCLSSAFLLFCCLYVVSGTLRAGVIGGWFFTVCFSELSGFLLLFCLPFGATVAIVLLLWVVQCSVPSVRVGCLFFWLSNLGLICLITDFWTTQTYNSQI